MSTLKDVIEILETTGEAMVGLNGFTYGNRSEINTLGEKGYPQLLIDRNLNVTSMELIGGRRVYSLLFQFYKLHQRDTEALDNDEVAQGELLVIAEQYLKEIRRRFKVDTRIRIVNDAIASGDFTFNYGNDKLLRLQLTVPIEVFDNSCNNGVFNYGT
jgi:hypothetical protein